MSAVVLGPQDRRSRAGWWGMVLLIVTEAMIFAALLSASFFVRANSPTWPQAGIEPPELGRIGVFTLVLLASSVPLLWGEAAIRRGQVGRLRIGLAVSWLLGAVFVVNQVLEFRDLPFARHRRRLRLAVHRDHRTARAAPDRRPGDERRRPVEGRGSAGSMPAATRP